MPDANWMATIEIPGISVLGAALDIDLKAAMEAVPEEFEKEFLHKLSENVTNLVASEAMLIREETEEGVKILIQFGFIPDLDEYREQLHAALLKAHALGMAQAHEEWAGEPSTIDG